MFNLILLILLGTIVLCLRGGRLHNFLVLEAENILNKAGFNTSLEHPQKLPNGGLDFVDILARQDKVLVCVEIETTSRYVLINATKARQLNIPLVVVVPNKKVKKAVKTKLDSLEIRPGGIQIKILLLSQLNKELTNYLSIFIAANRQTINR